MRTKCIQIVGLLSSLIADEATELNKIGPMAVQVDRSKKLRSLIDIRAKIQAIADDHTGKSPCVDPWSAMDTMDAMADVIRQLFSLPKIKPNIGDTKLPRGPYEAMGVANASGPRPGSPLDHKSSDIANKVPQACDSAAPVSQSTYPAPDLDKMFKDIEGLVAHLKVLAKRCLEGAK